MFENANFSDQFLYHHLVVYELYDWLSKPGILGIHLSITSETRVVWISPAGSPGTLKLKHKSI